MHVRFAKRGRERTEERKIGRVKLDGEPAEDGKKTGGGRP